MEKKGVVMQAVVVCAVVSVLGLITVILGVAGASSKAEACMHTYGFGIPFLICVFGLLILNIYMQSLIGKDEQGLCEYRSTPAVGCGIVATLFALTTQIVATAATGCCGCCRTFGIPTGGKRITAVVLSTVSWMLAIVVVVLFITGAIGSSGGETLPSGDGNCEPPATSPLFVTATILFLVAVVSQIISYVLLQTTAAKSPPQEQSGIPMGQPPVPPNASAPATPAEAGASTPPLAAPAPTV